jgi:hypothetical protein
MRASLFFVPGGWAYGIVFNGDFFYLRGAVHERDSGTGTSVLSIGARAWCMLRDKGAMSVGMSTKSTWPITRGDYSGSGFEEAQL